MEALPFDMGYLTEKMQEKARTELGETDEVKKEAVLALKQLLQENASIVCPMEDRYLLECLRARKFDLKRTLSLISNFYNIKKSSWKVYGTLDYPGFLRSVECGFINVLPYRDADGSAIVVIKLENWNVKERSFPSLVHDLTVLLMMCTEDPATQVAGIKMIFDLKSASPAHIKYVDLGSFLVLAKTGKNCMPVRFKEIHMVNENYVFYYFWSVVRYALSGKLRNRFYFHSTDFERLHNHFPLELLPIEYGGKLTLSSCSFLKQVHNMEQVYNKKMAV